jgi:hypothetical protein
MEVVTESMLFYYVNYSMLLQIHVQNSGISYEANCWTYTLLTFLRCAFHILDRISNHEVLGFGHLDHKAG